MLKNYEDYILGINNRKINLSSTIYAQILKNERIKHHMTLEDAAKNICSVSYLCKLENSSINTNTTFVKKLCDKLSLDYDTIENAKIDNLLTDVIKYVFYNKHQEINELYEKVKDLPFTSSIEIVKCFYYLNTNNYSAFLCEYKKLEKVKYTLDELESITIVYLLIFYNMLKYNYYEAYKYLKLVDYLRIDNSYLKYLFIEANIITAYNTCNQTRLINSYIQFEKIKMTGYPLSRIYVCKMIYNTVMCEEYPLNILDDCMGLDLSVLSLDYRLDVVYYLLLIKLKNNRYEDVYKEIMNNNYFFEARYIALLAYIAHRINKKGLFVELTGIAEKFIFEEKDFIHQKFTYFIIMFHSSNNTDEVIRYMKEHINPNLNVEVNLLYNSVYKQIYRKYMVGSSKYKEAYYHLLEYSI